MISTLLGSIIPPFGVVFKKNYSTKFVKRKPIDTMPENKELDFNLTERELFIVRRIAIGRTTPLIAAELNLSPETIKWHRKRLLAKFSASTSAEMVRKAMEAGLI